MVDSSVLQEDLRDMLTALGVSDHARPQSPHEVFRECIVRVERLRAANERLQAAQVHARKDGLTEAATWLRRNATAERDPKMRAAFVEAHNAILNLAESSPDEQEASG